MFDGAEHRTGYQMSASAEPDPCLLQLAAQHAGEPLTDRPNSVHPTLAAIARAVRDHSSAEGRAALKPLAQGLSATAQPGLETCARLVAMCVSTALASPEQSRVTADEREKLCAARSTALHLLNRTCAAVPSTEQTDELPQPCGSARWWLPVLGWLRRDEPFYRCFVAPEQVAEAIAVTARATGVDCDRRLRELLKLSIGVVPSWERRDGVTEP